MIYPGYIDTNISKNASVGKADEKFGKTDYNIANGMKVHEFCNQTVKAIHLGRTEITIADGIHNHILPRIGQIWAWFEDKGSSVNFKQQKEAVKLAK